MVQNLAIGLAASIGSKVGEKMGPAGIEPATNRL